MSIHVLDDRTINQIAAGEVIENPASVVKELMDNALDAGAKQITVEIQAGGFQLIRILDDGCGMTQDDAVLSIERHATSKILKMNDLLACTSMGFRGEALASIASISKFTLITAKEGSDHKATRVVVEGGRIQTVGPFSRPKGTTIEVRSLFYPVPARKKFQKSSSASAAEIYKTLSKVALSRPDVSITLISGGKEMLSTHARVQKNKDPFFEVIQKQVGKEITSNLLRVQYKDTYLTIDGYIGTPLVTRQNRVMQNLFINQRVVESPAVSLAVLDGYSTMITAKRYPVFFLHLKMDPKELDVNVHPQKKQIRLKEETKVKAILRESVTKALRREPVFEKTIHTDPFLEKGEVFEILEDKLFDPPSKQFKKSSLSSHEMKNMGEDFTFSSSNHFDFMEAEKPMDDLIPFEQPILPKVSDLSLIGLYQSSCLLDAKASQELIHLPDLAPPYEGLFFVDLKKAAARVYVDHAQKKQTQRLSIQKLLFPKTYQFLKEQMLFVETSLQTLEEIGIEARVFSQTQIIVEGLSEHLDEELLESLFCEIADSAHLDLCIEKIKERLLVKASSCIKAKTAIYTEESAKKLLSDLLKTSSPYFCPLGTKIIAYMSQSQYEKLFKK